MCLSILNIKLLNDVSKKNDQEIPNVPGLLLSKQSCLQRSDVLSVLRNTVSTSSPAYMTRRTSHIRTPQRTETVPSQKMAVNPPIHYHLSYFPITYQMSPTILRWKFRVGKGPVYQSLRSMIPVTRNSQIKNHKIRWVSFKSIKSGDYLISCFSIHVFLPVSGCVHATLEVNRIIVSTELSRSTS